VNPYKVNSPEWIAWNMGYIHGTTRLDDVIVSTAITLLQRIGLTGSQADIILKR
jgi:hypothetical protein